MTEEINQNNLPVLYTIPKWQAMIKIGRKILCYVLNYGYVTTVRLKFISMKYENRTSQEWYDRWILNITVPSQRPRCECFNCRNEVLWQGMDLTYSRGYCSDENHRRIVVSNRKSLAGLKRYENPEERKRQSEINREIGNRPEVKLSRSIKIKKYYENPEVRDKHSKKAKEALNKPGMHEKLSSSISNSCKRPETKEKRSNALIHRWSIQENKDNLSKKIIKAHHEGKYDNVHKGRGKKCKSFSIWENKEVNLDSTWELDFFEKCKSIDLVKSLNRESIKIYYVNPTDNSVHSYAPDFLLNDRYLIEIKPNYLIHDPVNQAKFHAAAIYCADHDLSYVIITEDYLFNHGSPYYGSLPFKL